MLLTFAGGIGGRMDEQQFGVLDTAYSSYDNSFGDVDERGMRIVTRRVVENTDPPSKPYEVRYHWDGKGFTERE